MMERRQFIKVGLGSVAGVTMLAATGCKGASAGGSGSTSGASEDAKGKVYFQSFKPEQDKQWNALAKIFTKETGIPMTVKTAAQGQYETELKSNMAKKEPPTLFQVNGPVGLASWKDYCYDLDGADIMNELAYDNFKLVGDDGKVKGVAYVIETYGIICNTSLLKKAGHKIEDITDFASLKKIAQDITKRKDELGFSAFGSAGLDNSSYWRYTTHLANLPIYYEYKADNIKTTDAIKGTYLPNYRDIFDLYINNETADPSQLSTKTADDATAEFVTGKCVFYQNGTWEYANIKDVGDDNLGILPIYIGVAGEQNQGLCTGSENYWCVNKNVSEDDIAATLKFMNWCVTSKAGVEAMCGTDKAIGDLDGMGFVIPFKKNKKSTNPLTLLSDKYLADGKTPVDWLFSTIPSENWKTALQSALTSYAADQSDSTWDGVKKAFVDGWATEAKASKKNA
ncbi:carbohydrate ABC transporter substrate-binding protein, CUT1 family [Coriobacterium glomerans PW2]|uniref:Carbohydrate ABC transporter substrate-binding protein, CUT1 family n=1 Tax=Coriobacterium glomerans (strain ATCC 49209 / DSM 20642 / JCM 10262 / PW2) TaxID=700015 RepID=F2N8D6_CORGP|nr:ABC transporter substrate-binding protein [Coriobacterium glomerans]AEB07319.1 carbohydrate ABC transporter substrate-binding protein, CUT1 family [Coriobacterium glomerans PW2]